MKILITNTRNSQAYTIIHALRPHAEKIVATMEGNHPVAAWFSHAARSRLVNKTYFVPSPDADWRAGRIQKVNTDREESFVRSVLRICEVEKIDTIFPSFDPHVYVFSKNKERFENLGIIIPVPDYDRVVIPLDKYRTIRAAEEVGFPCPRTYLVHNQEDLKTVCDKLGFPLVIKPRFTAGGRGMKMVRNFQELLKNGQASAASSHMIQEYIPGQEEANLITILDGDGVLKMSFADKRLRYLHRIHQNFPTVWESFGPHPYSNLAVKLAQKIGWQGSVTAQVKIDPRDGLPKLMELNPRLGYGLWIRVAAGINEPLMCIKIAKREKVEPVRDFPAGTMFVHPIEDLLALGAKLLDLAVYRFRTKLLAYQPIDASNRPLSIKELANSYKYTYLIRKNKNYDLYFTNCFNDSLTSILWWLQTLKALWSVAKELGK